MQISAPHGQQFSTFGTWSQRCAWSLLLAGASVQAAPRSCTDWAGQTLAPSAIQLPTRGADVSKAQVLEVKSTATPTPGPARSYCKLDVAIHALDANAPDILMSLNLPEQWNRKGLMVGGGGFNGSIPAADGKLMAGPAQGEVPLYLGYATFSSDSGHQANKNASRDGSFGGNDEAVRNFSGDALKKVHDAALALLQRHYQQPPTRLYFYGGSTGGREALAVAQRWPADWDGVVSMFPAWNAASLDLQFGRITRAFAAPGAYPSQAKRRRLFDAAMQACDALDGVKDGLISNQKACNARFDPKTATINGEPLRCANGADTGDTCLSDAQIAALQTFNTPIHLNWQPGSGETQYPGFNVWGSDLGMEGSHPLQKLVVFLSMGTVAPAMPMPAASPYGSVFWDQWVKYFVTRDANFDSLQLDPEHPGPWTVRLQALTGMQDVNSTDLSAFRKRGGKLLLIHGQSDVLVSTRATEQYFERLQSQMGVKSVMSFARYYEVPGYGHAYGTVFNAAWDGLGALDRWVEHGEAPAHLTVSDTAGVPGRTRPLCDYPAWPRYRGQGDVNSAASFDCVR